MARIDDLTILLTMVDKTSKAFNSVDKKMMRLQKITAAVKGGMSLMGKTIGAVFTAAAIKGAMFNNELLDMSRTTNESIRETQALFLAVQEADPATSIDAMNEALLTLKERVADARTGAGPLSGLMKDFANFDIDLNLDNSRLQLANFLEEVGKLDDANDRIFALKEVMGDEESRPFLGMINNTEKLTKLLGNLRTGIEDLPNIMSASDAQNIENTKKEVSKLNVAWQNFSNVVYQLVAPAVAAIVKVFTWALEKATTLTEKMKQMFNIGQDSTADIISFDDPTTGKGQAEQLAALQKRIDLIQDEVKEKQRLQVITAKDDYGKSLQASRAAEMAKQENKLADEMNLLLQRRIELESMVFKSTSIDVPALPEQPTLVTSSENIETNTKKFNFEAGGDDIEAAIRSDVEAANAQMQAMTEAQGQMRASMVTGMEWAKEQTQERAAQMVSSIGSIGSALAAGADAFKAYAESSGESGKKAFKVFKGLQIAAATASAYSAASQALAGFDSATLPERIGKAAAALSIGLGYVANISRLTASGGGSGGGGSSTSAPSASPQTTARGGTLQQETPRQGKTVIQLEGRDRTYDQTDIENLAEAFKRSGADIEVLYN